MQQTSKEGLRGLLIASLGNTSRALVASNDAHLWVIHVSRAQSACPAYFGLETDLTSRNIAVSCQLCPYHPFNGVLQK